MTQKNKPQWDGKSRVSNELYRKNFIEIFGEAPEEDPDDLPADPDNHDYE